MNLSATYAVSVSPATGGMVFSLPRAGEHEVDAAIILAVAGYRQWHQTPLAGRVDTLRRIGATLRTREEEVAQVITLEMDRSVIQARGEMVKSANLCSWYAEHGPAILTAETTQVESSQAVIKHRPLGTILAIIPWSSPVWQASRDTVPILLVGSSYLLKHTPNVMGSACLLGEIFVVAGLPNSVFGWVNATNNGVPQIIDDDRIAAVIVTGNVRADKAIGVQAGATLKKYMLELGDSGPFTILNDADLDEVVKAVITGRYQNSGQVCVTSKRFILEADITDAFTCKFVSAMAVLRMGDPRDEQNYVGSIARSDLYNELHQQVTAIFDEGVTLPLDAEKIERAGSYYAPIVLGNIITGMIGFRQELFGPVTILTTARDADHALALANDSKFGLLAIVYTTDEAQTQRFAHELKCDGVFLNGYCASDARVAFDGMRKSGFGRGLSHFGLRESCNAQTVWKDRR